MMEKRIKINCSSNSIKGRFTNNGDQWRTWTVTLEVPNVDVSEHIDHVEYVLHASFGSPPIEPPFQLQKEGWGEFDLLIHVYLKDPLVPSPQSYVFDLNFKKSKYANHRKIILGSGTEYKQQDFMIDLKLEQDLQARARASSRPCRSRRPTPKCQQLQEEASLSSGKKSKQVFQLQEGATSSTSSSFSPASSSSTASVSSSSPSSSSSSATSLITPPADSINKDLQQQQQQQQQQQRPNVVVHQNSSQDKQMRVCRSPHYILDPANDLSLVLDTETIDMAELKVLLEALDDTHLRQAFQIMKKYDTSKMNIQTTDNGAYYLIDMDTACSDLINELWAFVIDVEIEKCKESSTLSKHQQQQHEQQH